MASIIKWQSGETIELDKIRLISYNVLADAHLKANLYLYRKNNPENLELRTRFQKIFKAIATAVPDFTLLQEVQQTHLDEFRKELAQLATPHDALYSKRPNGKPDGCLISYNQERFLHLDNYYSAIDYSIQCPIEGISDNTGQVAVFKEFEIEDRFIITANTHLVYAPNRGHTKLWQAVRLSYEILKTKRRIKKDFGVSEESVNVIVGGDMNAVLKSPLCAYFCGEDIDTSKVNNHELAGQKSKPPKTPSLLENKIPQGSLPFMEGPVVESKLSLKRVYSIEENTDKCTTIGRRMYDHLFVSDSVKILDKIDIPFSTAAEYILPNDEHGSDHVPIGLSFQL